jgi:hypothetical protein
VTCFLFSPAHTVKLGKAGELRLVDTFFSFLQRHTDVLNTVESIEELQLIAQKHCGTALDAAEAAATAAEIDAPVVASTVNESISSAPDASASADPVASPTPTQTDASSDSACTGAPPNKGNGGSGPGYTWTQTITELCVRVPIDSSVRGRDVSVELEDSQLIVAVAGVVAVEGTLQEDVKPDTLTWVIEDDSAARVVAVYVGKLREMAWWPCALRGHPEVDTAAIQPENSRLDDLDGGTREMVQKMMVCLSCFLLYCAI